MIVAIQAGGRSSRMGTDKAWLKVNDRPMIEHVLTAARSLAEQMMIVVNAANQNFPHYENLAFTWQAKLLPDLHDHRGPLGGIATVLQQCPADDVALILACDLPFVSAAFLQLLGKIHAAENPDLTVPLDEQGRPQMLAAMYAARCFHPVTTMLAANDLKAQHLTKRVHTRLVSFAEYAHLPGAQNFLRNLNTPEEYKGVASQL